jgi:threonine dehydratase
MEKYAADVPLSHLQAAAEVVARHLAPTPLVRVELPGFQAPAFLKLETLQPTGSFKVRGALAAAEAYRATSGHLVTASAGNHGLGIAYASATLRVNATVFAPRWAPAPKVEGMRRLGVDLRLVGEGYDEAELAAIAYAEETGAAFVSAYADPHVIAGQATVVGEVAAVLEGPFQIVVPVGGGGLAAGTALGAAGLDRDVRVVGVEAAASLAVSAAMAAGRVVEVPVHPTLADGLAGNLDPRASTPELLSAHRVDVLAVTEAEIAAAIPRLLYTSGVLAEGSGAVGVAAVVAGRIRADLPTVLVITGRNIARERLLEVLGAGR